VIINSLEKQLQEEREARKRLEEELNSIKELSL
jgi:predicted RNase H-like nuclease (RuvC/YqgF family)